MLKPIDRKRSSLRLISARSFSRFLQVLMSVWIPTDFKSVSLTSEKFDENLEIGRSKTVKNCDGKIVDPKLQSLETISATKRFHFRQKAPSPRSGNVSFAWRYNTRGCHTMNTEKSFVLPNSVLHSSKASIFKEKHL